MIATLTPSPVSSRLHPGDKLSAAVRFAGHDDRIKKAGQRTSQYHGPIRRQSTSGKIRASDFPVVTESSRVRHSRDTADPDSADP